MHAIESLVPGFEQALETFPGAHENLRRLHAAHEQRSATERAQALIGVALAYRLGGEYARWVMERNASRQGLSAEDILLASVGAAIHPRDERTVKAAWQTTASLESTHKLAPYIEFAALACTVLGMLAPAIGRAEAQSRKA